MTLISWIDGDGRESHIDLPIVPREVKVDGRVVNVEQHEPEPVVSYEEYPLEDRYCSNCKYEPVRVTEQPCIDCRHVGRCLWQPANPKPVDTGLDAEGLPEDWTWFDGLNGKQFCVIGRNTSTMNDLSRCIIAYYPIDNAITYRGTRKGYWADLHFLGRSAPGCDLDGKPLVGSEWKTPMYDKRTVASVTDTVINWKRCPESSFDANSLDWWFGAKEEVSYLRMSQLDPPKPEPEPEPKPEPKLSETVKVGTVFKWQQCDNVDERTVDFVGDERFSYHGMQFGKMMAWSSYRTELDGPNTVLVSYPEDKPLHERVRLWNKVRSLRTGNTFTVKVINGLDKSVSIEEEITGGTMTFYVFDKDYELVEE